MRDNLNDVRLALGAALILLVLAAAGLYWAHRSSSTAMGEIPAVEVTR